MKYGAGRALNAGHSMAKAPGEWRRKSQYVVPRGFFVNESCSSFHQPPSRFLLSSDWLCSRIRNLFLPRTYGFCCSQLSSNSYVLSMLAGLPLPTPPMIKLTRIREDGSARWRRESIFTIMPNPPPLEFILVLRSCYHNAQTNAICMLRCVWCTRSKFNDWK